MTENFHHMTSKFPLLWISSNTDINIHVRAEWFMTHRESHTCWKYLSQLMYSLSWESCSLLVLMYCQRAWMMQERVWVWMPSRRARRGSSLNWGGCGSNVIDLQHFFTTAHSRAHQTVLYFPRLENGCHVRQQSLKWCFYRVPVSRDGEGVWDVPPPPRLSPGSPASAAECSARSRLLAVSPGSRLSPGWWVCDATETAKPAHTDYTVS